MATAMQKAGRKRPAHRGCVEGVQRCDREVIRDPGAGDRQPSSSPRSPRARRWVRSQSSEPAIKIAAVHAAEWADKIKTLTAELQRLQDLAANSPKDPVTGQLTNGKPRWPDSIHAKSTCAGQGRSGSVRNHRHNFASEPDGRPYLTAFNTISSGFLQVQQQMILARVAYPATFANMGANLVVMRHPGRKWLASEAAAQSKILRCTRAHRLRRERWSNLPLPTIK